MSDDLVAFLRARLDEDAQVAQAAAAEGRVWAEGEPGGLPSAGVWAEDGTDPAMPVVYDEGRPLKEQASHIARHDPARVLREVEAKRRIVERLADDAAIAEHPLRAQRATTAEWDLVVAARDTLRLLALPYADHPDYRAEDWAPAS